MILGNVSIREALTEGRLVLEPWLGIVGNSSALDLRLGAKLQIPKDTPRILDPIKGRAKDVIAEAFNERVMDSTGYVLEPQAFVLGWTLEYVALPLQSTANQSLAARVEGRSSLARYGLLVHFTAPTIHAGFSGNIQLEMVNLGRHPIRLVPELPICQLILEQVHGIPEREESQFHGQRP
ncbi:MAG: dCTP deaminase [bacterium]